MAPIFDIDDLYFLNWSGLALRHVELALGKIEFEEGSVQGDAVSLANFGRGDRKSPIENTPEFCIEFQKKLEAFIMHSYRNYHSANNHYQDAAFMLVNRDDDARFPYDFGSYALGKCGSRGFSKQAVFALLSSEQYDNEDIEHAVLNTLKDLKLTIKALKLTHLEKLSMNLQRVERPVFHIIDSREIEAVMPQLMHELLAKVRHLYEQDIFIPASILALLSTQTMTIQMLNSINQLLDDLAPMKKEEGLFTLKIEDCSIEILSQDAVYQLLFKYIENQNLPKVLLCLEKLPKGNTDFDMTSLLQKAASFTNTNIVRAIYEHTPQSLQWPCDPSPLFLAIHAGHLANVSYLLSIKQAQAQDFYSKILNQHAFTNFPVDVMRDLFASGLIDIGNEIESIYENPLALAYGEEEFLKMLLPHANHRSKLTALLRLMTELHYANQCIDSMHDWIACLRRCIFMVLNSLTSQEASCIATQKHRILQSQYSAIQDLFFEEIRVHHYNLAFAEKNQSLINHITLAFGDMRSTQCVETQTASFDNMESVIVLVTNSRAIEQSIKSQALVAETMTEANNNESNEFVIGVCDVLMNQLEVRKRAIQWRLNSGQWFQNDAKCREKIAAIDTVSQAWQRDHDIKNLSKLLHEKASILTQTTSTLPSFFQRDVATKEVLARYSPVAFLR